MPSQVEPILATMSMSCTRGDTDVGGRVALPRRDHTDPLN